SVLTTEALLDDEVRQASEARRRRTPERRGGLRIERRILIGLAALALVLLAGALYARQEATTLQVQLLVELRSGQDHLEAGKTALKLANEQHSAAKIKEAQTDFNAAKASFAHARHRADSSALLTIAARIPGPSFYLGPRLAAIDSLSDM